MLLNFHKSTISFDWILTYVGLAGTQVSFAIAPVSLAQMTLKDVGLFMIRAMIYGCESSVETCKTSFLAEIHRC